VLKKFYRGNNITNGVTFANKNLTFVVTQHTMKNESYAAVSLALAREKAQAMRDEIAAGTDPVSKRKSSRQALHEQQEVEKRLAWTFRRSAEKFIEAKKPGWRNAKHAQQWQNTLASYAYPLIGDMAVTNIRVEHIMQIVEPHWTTKNETINRVRNRI